MTIDLNGQSDQLVQYRLTSLQGDIYQWCRRVRHGS